MRSPASQVLLPSLMSVRVAAVQAALMISPDEAARRVHFLAMAALTAFVGIHLVMVALVPRTLLAMIRGR